MRVSNGLKEELLRLMRKTGYSDKVIEYFRNKVNVGRIENADWVSDYTGPCGDTLQIYLRISNGIIEDAKFQYLGCPGASSSASAITEMAKGKTLEEAKKLTEKEVLRELEGLPKSKLHCPKLAVTTLRRAIAEYKALGPFESNKIREEKP